MPVSITRRNLARVVVLALCAVGVWVSCAKEPLRVDRNRPPSTYLVGAPAESSSASYKIHLYWRGEDPDGYIAGFLWSWDDSTIAAFRFTTKTDSIFELQVNDSLALVQGTGQQQPGQTKNHTFYIRAVDNLGKADPGLARFNKRVYSASTEVPTVRFVGPLPSGRSVNPDTLCDHDPFKICWTGSDPDGYVKYYRWDVGVFSKGFSTDTCAVFNDPSDPTSTTLVNGVYTFTVTATDNAFSVSNPAVGGRTLFVVNHDPQTVILGTDASAAPGTTGAIPVGYYQAPFDSGSIASPVWYPFYETDGQTVTLGNPQDPWNRLRSPSSDQPATIPYRSKIYFNWHGFDDACDVPSGIAGYAAVLRGTRNGGDPYITGFRNFLCERAPGDSIFFTTNNPEDVGTACGFTELILDSLDAGRRIEFTVASRDLSGRADGIPAAFQFKVNFEPHVTGLTVADAPGTPPSKTFTWIGTDPEDGYTGEAVGSLDDILTQNYRAVPGQALQSVTIPEATFRGLAPSNPHKFTVRVKDRAGYLSPEAETVTFDISP